MRIRIQTLIKRTVTEALNKRGQSALLAESSASKVGSKKTFPYIRENVAYFFQGESSQVVSGLDAGAKDCWTYSKKIYHLQKIKLTKSAIFSLKLKVQTSKITLTWSVKYGIHGFGSANLLSYRCKYGSESANPNYVSGDLSTVYRIYLILLVEFDFFYNTVT